MPDFRLNRRPDEHATTGRCAILEIDDVPVLTAGVPFRYWDIHGEGDHPPISLEAFAEGRVRSDLGVNNRERFEKHLATHGDTMPPTERRRRLAEVADELDRTPPPKFSLQSVLPWPFADNDACVYLGRARRASEVVALVGDRRDAFAEAVADACEVQGIRDDVMARILATWPETGPSHDVLEFGPDEPRGAFLVFTSAHGDTLRLRVDAE